MYCCAQERGYITRPESDGQSKSSTTIVCLSDFQSQCILFRLYFRHNTAVSSSPLSATFEVIAGRSVYVSEPYPVRRFIQSSKLRAPKRAIYSSKVGGILLSSLPYKISPAHFLHVNTNRKYRPVLKNPSKKHDQHS